MPTVILLRHGRSTANADGTLTGRLPGVHLDDVGRRQADAAAERIAAVPLVELVTSPLERCRETARVVSARHPGRPRVHSDKGLTECDYGEWQGRKLRDLSRQSLWRTVQGQPSAATFPGGESLSQMQARAVAAVRRRDAAIAIEHGSHAVWVGVTHGDIIKSLLADALGMHLDLFQRLQVDPASVSVIRYTDARPYVLASNTREGDLSWLGKPARRRGRRSSDDAAVGGGAGPA